MKIRNLNPYNEGVKMHKFNETEVIELAEKGLALRPSIENAIDDIWAKGINRICWLGIGGTWASGLQAYVHMKEKSSMEIFVENATEYIHTGNKRIHDKTLVIFSSVTGTTSEMVKALEIIKKTGATILGFVDTLDTPLSEIADICLTTPKNEQLKFFMVADRLMYHEGCFDEYDDFYSEMDAHFPKVIAEAEKNADEYALAYAKRHAHDDIHYFIGAGAIYGATYSYAMCYWEEMHHIRTKSIHAGEVFHGMLEIIYEDTPITVFVGEDSQREVAIRVIRFLEKVNKNHEVIDSKDIKAEGISEKYRGYISHLLVHAVTNRIDIAIEQLTGMDLDTRRYYRKMDY